MYGKVSCKSCIQKLKDSPCCSTRITKIVACVSGLVLHLLHYYYHAYHMELHLDEVELLWDHITDTVDAPLIELVGSICDMLLSAPFC